MKYIVSEMLYSGGVCPFQAEFKDMDGHFYYARYRHGTFSMRRSIEPQSLHFSDKFENIMKMHFGENGDGYMDLEELKEITKGILVWPTDKGILRICQKQQIIAKYVVREN